MLRPTIAALFPSIEMSYAFNTSITASAVHGANPVESPENTFAIFTGEMPSRSFFGSIMASMSFCTDLLWKRTKEKDTAYIRVFVDSGKFFFECFVCDVSWKCIALGA